VSVRFALIANHSTPTNRALCCALLDAARWEEMTPHSALETLRSGDGALGRLDVLATLDGVDDGLWALGALAARGVHVLNDPAALLATHDKLLTARLLRRSAIPHPTTFHVRGGRRPPPFVGPVVIKPRFGSWGSGVHRCDDAQTFEETLARVSGETWFERHGALVQQLVPPKGYDLRLVVAAGRIVGAVHRIAAPGEWRTNVNLGAVRRRVEDPSSSACAMAVAAARAAGAALVGVDLLPTPDGGWVVIELNGAVEFTSEYSEWVDVFAESALLLEGEVVERRIAADAGADPLRWAGDPSVL
jgi:RimK family alpha-L-glutamate ligase